MYSNFRVYLADTCASVCSKESSVVISGKYFLMLQINVCVCINLLITTDLQKNIICRVLNITVYICTLSLC